MGFSVALDAYHGPLDLLLHLVQREEVPIAELPLATLAEQYLEHVAAVEHLDPDGVGEFLDIASLLLELKSRSVLPEAEASLEPAVADDDPPEPAEGLVQRLLEYQRLRESTDRLEAVRLDWSRRFTRRGAVVASPPSRDDGRPLEGVELWDLVSAFARVMRDRLEPPPVATIPIDDTPQHVYMERIDLQVRQSDGPVPFDELFPERRMPRATLVGLFLALLELIRYRHARAWQTEPFGPITVGAGPEPFVPLRPATATAD